MNAVDDFARGLFMVKEIQSKLMALMAYTWNRIWEGQTYILYYSYSIVILYIQLYTYVYIYKHWQPLIFPRGNDGWTLQGWAPLRWKLRAAFRRCCASPRTRCGMFPLGGFHLWDYPLIKFLVIFPLKKMIGVIFYRWFSHDSRGLMIFIYIYGDNRWFPLMLALSWNKIGYKNRGIIHLVRGCHRHGWWPESKCTLL